MTGEARDPARLRPLIRARAQEAERLWWEIRGIEAAMAVLADRRAELRARQRALLGEASDALALAATIERAEFGRGDRR